jgi:hypothetical protein
MSRYWIVKEGQDTSDVFTGYGAPQPCFSGDDLLFIPLETIEWEQPNRVGEPIESVRYFGKLKKEAGQ